MSKIDLLLDGEIDTGNIKLNVNEYNRTITYDGGEIILGVEGDYKAEKVYFYFPINLTDKFDIQSQNVKVFITYENANGEVRIHKCNKEVVSEEEAELYSVYSWTLSSKVTEYKGTVKFMVCAKQYSSDGKQIQNEWHSAICEGTVLDGLHAIDNYTTELYPDLSVSIKDYEIKVDELKTMFSSITNSGYNLEDYFANMETYNAALERKAAVTHGHDSEDIRYINARSQEFESLTATLDDIYTQFGAIGGDIGKEINFYTQEQVNDKLDTKADVTHSHDSEDIRYINARSQDLEGLTETLDDIYQQLDEKTDIGHMHTTGEICHHSLDLLSTLDNMLQDMGDRATTSYVDNTFMKKNDIHLYEHNVQILGTGSTDDDSSSISSMLLQIKIFNNDPTPISNYVKFRSYIRDKNNESTGNMVVATGAFKLKNDINQLRIITGVGHSNSNVLYGNLNIYFVNYTAVNGVNISNTYHQETNYAYLQSDKCVYTDCIRQII